MMQRCISFLLVTILATKSNCGFIRNYLRLDSLKNMELQNVATTLLTPTKDVEVFNLPSIEFLPTKMSQQSKIDQTLKNELNVQPGAKAYSYTVIDEATAYVFDDGFWKTEYILADRKLKWHQAKLYCQHKFRGKLADLRLFTETQFIQDNIMPELDSNEIVWLNRAPKYAKTALQSGNHCRALQSSSYDPAPHIIGTVCTANRRFICKRSENRRRSKSLHGTHPGWIQIGDRFYKIYADPMTFYDASVKCMDEDPTASLAVAFNATEVQQLGRYMRITRPSIEVAWLGAIYTKEDEWIFPNEYFKISNENGGKDKDGLIYPNWHPQRREKSVRNCIALANYPTGSYFKEVPCDAIMQGYICYKPTRDVEKLTQFCANRNYELSVHPASWQDAKEACRTKNLILAEPKNDLELSCLSHIMTELPPKPISHIWLGGKGTNSGGWAYLSDKTNVILAAELWMKNLSIVPQLDKAYSCLNMDKLSLDRIKFYGTDCKFKQRFVCQSNNGLTWGVEENMYIKM